MDPSQAAPAAAPAGPLLQQRFAALTQRQKVAFAVGGAVLALALVVLVALPPRLLTLKEYKELREKKSRGGWILEGKVHSWGETLGAAGAPREQISLGGVRLHFLRLEDASGDRGVVWLDPARTPIPPKETPVRLTGSFHRVPVQVGGKTLGEKTVGVVSKMTAKQR